MLSSAEALRLEIDIARIVGECAANKDPEQRTRLQARLAVLCAKRNSVEGTRTCADSELEGEAAIIIAT